MQQSPRRLGVLSVSAVNPSSLPTRNYSGTFDYNQGMLEKLTTEGRNPASEEIDRLTTLQVVRLMNQEDATVSAAVADQAEAIAQAVDQIADRLRGGGRLIYVGAGTSGRLGVLHACRAYGRGPR